MKYKVHWLIDGLVEIDANDADTAENLIKIKIETLFSHAGQLLVITMIIRMRSGLRAKLSLKSKRAG